MPKITRHGGASYEDRAPATQEDVDRIREAREAAAAGADKTAETDGPDYDEWAYADLQAEAKRRELKASGSRDELAARLVEHDAQRGTPADEPA